jgi:hypothetical protein
LLFLALRVSTLHHIASGLQGKKPLYTAIFEKLISPESPTTYLDKKATTREQGKSQ